MREALRGRREVLRLWASEAAAGEPWLANREVRPTSAAELRELSDSDEHQGVCAEVESYPYAEAGRLLEPDDALVVCLDQVQDPHNLGATCRVAEVAGASGIVIPGRRAAEVTPAVCKASAGAVEHLPLARVRNLADWLIEAKQAGAWIYGADAEAALPYDRPDYQGRVVLVLGSEGRGLRPRVAGACDELIAVPVRGNVASLNVASAAAALVYGILQVRGDLDRAP